MVKILLPLIIGIFVIFCLWGGKMVAKDFSVSEEVADPLISKIAKRLGKKYNIHPAGAGVSSPDGIVEHFGISFQLNRSLTKEEAREILVSCVGELLILINEDKKIRPYLRNFPFKIKNVSIYIFMTNRDGSDIYDPAIRIASSSHGKLSYDTKDKNQPYGYKSTTTESYEEALKAISEGENDLITQKRG